MFLSWTLESIDRQIEHDNSDDLGGELNETPIEKRTIFKINDKENISYAHYGSKDAFQRLLNSCYRYMIEILKKEEETFIVGLPFKDGELDRIKEIRSLLRKIWKRNEPKLAVNSYTADIDEEKFAKDEESKQWGVYTSISRNTTESDWHEAYDRIFHEFFHNIDHAVKPCEKVYFSSSYANNKLADAIKKDVQELLDVENGKKNGDKLLNEITFRTPDKKYKSAIYDIIGAVFYKGKYGCYPGNSSIYNNGKECENKVICRCAKECKSCKYKLGCPSSLREGRHANVIKCKYRKEAYPHRCIAKVCVFKPEFDYRVECNLQYNVVCKNIHGHRYDYWMMEDFLTSGCVKHKDISLIKSEKVSISKETCLGCEKYGNIPKCINSDKFHKTLSEEAFANFAAAAITDIEAYRNIIKCLPESEKVFRDIIRSIISIDQGRNGKHFWLT